MNLQKKYWDEKIKSWTKSSYEKKFSQFDLIERLANFFRGPIVARMEEALKIIGPRSKNKIVLDLGCGLGNFCFAILRYSPRKVIGLDISEVAVKEARKIAKKKKVSRKVKFIQKDIPQLEKLPDFDFAVGLGFIDYLNKDELKRLFRLLKNGYFLLSVFEKKLSWRNFFHDLYVRIQKCPGAYKYSREEIKNLAPKNLGLYFLEKNKMLFITNLPKDK